MQQHRARYEVYKTRSRLPGLQSKLQPIAEILIPETKIAVNPEEHAKSAGPSELPYFLKKEVLPVDLIIYLGNFMESKDSASSKRRLSPNHDEGASIPAKLRKESTDLLRIEFLNGKHLDIEYKFEHTKTNKKEKKKRVLINVNTLLPVLGGRLPPDTETFVDVKKVNAFVETYVHLNKCNDQRYASCPCHLDVDPEIAAKFEPSPDNACAAGHFHHFCFQHVNHWLSETLEVSIEDLGKGVSYDESLTSELNDVLATCVYFRKGVEMFLPDRIDNVLFHLLW